jgi:pilus assembly protein Flp/PilA
MKKLINRFLKNEDGATAIEYGLIAALIAVVIIGALGSLGNNTASRFNTVANAIGTR